MSARSGNGSLRRAAIYRCETRHTRTAPIRNSFRYGGYMWLVDIDDLPRLPQGLGALARFEAKDHLGDPERSIRHNVDAFCERHGIDLTGGRVLMLANARVFGYVFNPLSVYWCYDARDELVTVLAEVHNTYGDRHVYLLRPDESGRARTGKRLYVSPFFDMEGTYEMRLREPDERLDVGICLRRRGSVPFVAALRGWRRPATVANVLKMSARHPLMPLWVSFLIRFQGVKLWARRLRVVPRPTHRPQPGVQR